MLQRIRLLPIVIALAVVLLVVRVGDIWDGLSQIPSTPSAAPGAAMAQEAEEGEAASADSGNGAAEGDTRDEAPTTDEMATDGLDEEPLEFEDEVGFSASELIILENLQGRREELEEKAVELELREKMLEVAESRIDDKVSELKRLEATIRDLLVQHDDEEETQMRRLVKVYENMKPKDAAKIFERLELEILLNVTERMREVKVAPIFAAMSPEVAERVTEELATRRQLPDSGG